MCLERTKDRPPSSLLLFLLYFVWIAFRFCTYHEKVLQSVIETIRNKSMNQSESNDSVLSVSKPSSATSTPRTIANSTPSSTVSQDSARQTGPRSTEKNISEDYNSLKRDLPPPRNVPRSTSLHAVDTQGEDEADVVVIDVRPGKSPRSGPNARATVEKDNTTRSDSDTDSAASSSIKLSRFKYLNKTTNNPSAAFDLSRANLPLKIRKLLGKRYGSDKRHRTSSESSTGDHDGAQEAEEHALEANDIPTSRTAYTASKAKSNDKVSNITAALSSHAAPVPRDTVTIPRGALSVVRATSPVSQDTIPVARDLVQGSRDRIAVPCDAAPVSRDTVTIPRGALSVVRATSPVSQDTIPVTRDLVQGSRDRISVPCDVAPVSHDVTGLSRDLTRHDSVHSRRASAQNARDTVRTPHVAIAMSHSSLTAYSVASSSSSTTTSTAVLASIAHAELPRNTTKQGSALKSKGISTGKFKTSTNWKSFVDNLPDEAVTPVAHSVPMSSNSARKSKTKSKNTLSTSANQNGAVVGRESRLADEAQAAAQSSASVKSKHISSIQSAVPSDVAVNSSSKTHSGKTKLKNTPKASQNSATVDRVASNISVDEIANSSTKKYLSDNVARDKPVVKPLNSSTKRPVDATKNGEAFEGRASHQSGKNSASSSKRATNDPKQIKDKLAKSTKHVEKRSSEIQQNGSPKPLVGEKTDKKIVEGLATSKETANEPKVDTNAAHEIQKRIKSKKSERSSSANQDNLSFETEHISSRIQKHADSNDCQERMQNLQETSSSADTTSNGSLGMHRQKKLLRSFFDNLLKTRNKDSRVEQSATTTCVNSTHMEVAGAKSFSRKDDTVADPRTGETGVLVQDGTAEAVDASAQSVSAKKRKGKQRDLERISALKDSLVPTGQTKRKKDHDEEDGGRKSKKSRVVAPGRLVFIDVLLCVLVILFINKIRGFVGGFPKVLLELQKIFSFLGNWEKLSVR